MERTFARKVKGKEGKESSTAGSHVGKKGPIIAGLTRCEGQGGGVMQRKRVPATRDTPQRANPGTKRGFGTSGTKAKSGAQGEVRKKVRKPSQRSRKSTRVSDPEGPASDPVRLTDQKTRKKSAGTKSPPEERVGHSKN